MSSAKNSLFGEDPCIPVITEIQPLDSDPNMRRIKVGRQTMATLRAADVEALALKIGQPWTEPLAKSVLAEVAANKARSDAMHLLGRRAYSRGEIVQKLQKKGYDQATAMRIGDELATDRWIDDDAYGQAIVEEAARRKPAAEELLLAKLQRRKIEPEAAKRIARAAVAGVDPVAQGLELARDRIADWESMPPEKTARRIAGMLARRGFDEQVVTDVIAKLGLHTDSG